VRPQLVFELAFEGIQGASHPHQSLLQAMPNFICAACGTQYADSLLPPEHCAICEDERQYVDWDGQRWTTLDELQSTSRNEIRPEGPGLVGIGTVPSFAIGQRALHVAAPGGSVLWDCISLVDDRTVAALLTYGRVRAIAVSHPHYYASMVEWSRALGGVPVYLHAGDRQWVMRPDPCIVFWEGEQHALGDGLTLIRCGGHFAGGTVLHWRDGAGGRGALLCGDIIQVVGDRRWVSFMYSFPNFIPLDAATVRRVADAVAPFDFEQVYGAWWRRNVTADGSAAVRRSVERYVRALEGPPPRPPHA
jgi:glyoxylase-like metal-dependent hydrolase (beta-lactamase superfamily II)